MYRGHSSYLYNWLYYNVFWITCGYPLTTLIGYTLYSGNELCRVIIMTAIKISTKNLAFSRPSHFTNRTVFITQFSYQLHFKHKLPCNCSFTTNCLSRKHVENTFRFLRLVWQCSLDAAVAGQVSGVSESSHRGRWLQHAPCHPLDVLFLNIAWNKIHRFIACISKACIESCYVIREGSQWTKAELAHLSNLQYFDENDIRNNHVAVMLDHCVWL